MPPNALAAAVPWALWIYFIFSQVSEHHKPCDTNIKLIRLFSFLDRAMHVSFLLMRRLTLLILGSVLCSLLLYIAHQVDRDGSEIFELKWHANSAELLVNISAMWPIPYAIFHRFPHPSLLPAEVPLTSNLHAARQTPFACSINIHQ
jgi:hypothetical protein